jgi:putative transposase
VFIPKYRQKTLFKELRRYLGEVFHDLARQKESWIEEGHLLEDHVHMLVSIPPKHAVSSVIGFMKGKSAIHQSLAGIPAGLFFVCLVLKFPDKKEGQR